MGRGRAKAKQTKVARRLKYYSPDTDLSALERELRSESDELSSEPLDDDDDADTDDLDHPGGDEDDYEAWASGQR